MSLSVGARFAGYRVDRHIARGGMGDVYLAWHEVLRRHDAVKVLRPEFADDPVFRERFLREANLAALVKHPAVVTVYTAGEVAGRMFIASEYIAGGDLRSRVPPALGPEEAARVITTVAGALDAAHHSGLVHRDVKPENVLLANKVDGVQRIYLIDFGITRLQKATTTLTDKNTLLGTVGYIAPEQILGARIDGRADQYSLACLAFECLTGALPFPNLPQPAMLQAHLETPAPLASSRDATLSTRVDEVLERGLAKTPNQRYETCSDFAAALLAAFGRREVPGATNMISLPTAVPVADLSVVGGPQAGLRLPLVPGEHVVGRGSAADLQVPDRFLSRRHFFVTASSDGKVEIRDAESANGTYLDGVRLSRANLLRPMEWAEAGASLFELQPHRPRETTRTADDGKPTMIHRAPRLLESAAPARSRVRRRRLTAADELAGVRGSAPNAPGLAIAAMDRSAQLWERRRSEGDALTLRLGSAPLRPHEQRSSPAVPLTWDLLAQGPLIISGDLGLAEGLLRWLIMQAACLVGPDELQITVALPTDEILDWWWRCCRHCASEARD